jgi:hypothetical protein
VWGLRLLRTDGYVCFQHQHFYFSSFCTLAYTGPSAEHWTMHASRLAPGSITNYDILASDARESPKQSGSESPKQSGSESPKQSGSESPKQSGSESPKQSGSESPKQSGSESPAKPGSTGWWKQPPPEERPDGLRHVTSSLRYNVSDTQLTSHLQRRAAAAPPATAWSVTEE